MKRCENCDKQAVIEVLIIADDNPKSKDILGNLDIQADFCLACQVLNTEIDTEKVWREYENKTKT